MTGSTLVCEPTYTYGGWLSAELPDLRDADDWDDAFGYINVWARCIIEPEYAVHVHVVCPGAAQDHSENTGWCALG